MKGGQPELIWCRKGKNMDMRENKHHNRRRFLSVCAVSLLLTGCGGGSSELAVIDRTPYEKLSYETVQAQRGDLEPELTLKLKAEGFERITYDAVSDELQLDTVHVTVGDRVEKGDVLVSFQSESIQQVIDEYEEQRTQNQLLIDHYTRLMQIDSSVDYSEDISRLREDAQVAALYVEEAKERLARYQIVAEESGTITAMDNYLQNGSFVPGRNLITQVTGTGKYEADRPEGYEFTVGETHTATVGAVSYELQVAEITEDKVIFTPVSDMSSVSEEDTLLMTITLPSLTDVVYVEAAAVHEADGMYFVYVQDENGYRDAVKVTVGNKVAQYMVITEGLSGGEKVTLK